MVFGPVLMSGAYYCFSYMGNQYHSKLFILVQVCEKVQIPILMCQNYESTSSDLSFLCYEARCVKNSCRKRRRPWVQVGCSGYRAVKHLFFLFVMIFQAVHPFVQGTPAHTHKKRCHWCHSSSGLLACAGTSHLGPLNYYLSRVLLENVEFQVYAIVT